MLLLRVVDGDYVMIGEDIKVRFYRDGNLFKLAVDAPDEYRIQRKSVYEKENPDTVDDFVTPAKRTARSRK